MGKDSQRSRIHRIRWAVGKVQKKLDKMRFPCLYPGCEKFAISSHSQQKEGQLRAIAKNGLVYALNRNMASLTKGMPLLIKVGIREASVFQGYCGNHDRDIFSPIEKKPLIPGDPEQASLFFLRAASMEYSRKRRGAIHLRMLADVVGNDADEESREHNVLWRQGMELYLQREGPFILGQILRIISTRNFDGLHTFWFRLPRTIPISVATCVCPWLNDYPQKWSPSLTNPQPMVSFSVIPAEGQTDVITSWLDYSHADSKWIQVEMETLEGVEGLVNLFGLAESEDFCINIDFWESLPHSSQELILYNMRPNTFRGPLNAVPLIVKLQ